MHDQRALASPGLLLLFRAMPIPGARGEMVLGSERQVGPCEPRSAGRRWLAPSWRGLPAPGRSAFLPHGSLLSLTSQHLMKSLPFGSLRDYNMTAAGPSYSLQPSMLLLH